MQDSDGQEHYGEASRSSTPDAQCYLARGISTVCGPRKVESNPTPCTPPPPLPPSPIPTPAEDNEHLYAEEDVAMRRSTVMQRCPFTPPAAVQPPAQQPQSPQQQDGGEGSNRAAGAGRPRVSWDAWFADPTPHPSARESTQGDEGFDGVPDSLARLLHAYLPPPPTAAAVDAVMPAVDDHVRQWCTFLPMPAPAARYTPLPQETALTQSAAVTHAECTETFAEAQQRLLKRNARRPPAPHRFANWHNEAAFSAFRRNAENHQRLWYLLSEHGDAASGCTRLCLGLCDALAVMRGGPPPSSSSSSATAQDAAREIPRSTCPCGCLIDGVFRDEPLYHFHQGYYRHHHAAPTEGSGANVGSGAPLSPSLSSLRVSLQLDVLPLLALQTLAGFVWQRSTLEYTARCRRRLRTVAAQRTGQPPPPSPAALADAFRTSCGTDTCLCAAVACACLAWGHLEMWSERTIFTPRLKVDNCAQVKSRGQQQQESRVEETGQSWLAHAAELTDSSPDALKERLLRHLQPPHTPTAPSSHLAALHRLRLCLLTQACRLPVWCNNTGGSGGAPAALRSPPPAADTSASSSLPGAEVNLVNMEISVSASVGHNTAQMPLWCDVALEVVRLHTEGRRRGRLLLYRARGAKALTNARAYDDGAKRGVCRQVGLLVRHMVRLLMLPTLLWGASAEEEAEEREADAGVRTRASEGARAPWRRDLAMLSAYMASHPLFGVAAAVAWGAVPLKWAATCVAGTARGGAEALVRGCRVREELARLVQDTQRMVRHGENMASSSSLS